MSSKVLEYYNRFEIVYDEYKQLKRDDPTNPRLETLKAELIDLTDKATALTT
jgi:hypothetical protein